MSATAPWTVLIAVTCVAVVVACVAVVVVLVLIASRLPPDSLAAPVGSGRVVTLTGCVTAEPSVFTAAALPPSTLTEPEMAWVEGKFPTDTSSVPATLA